MSDESRSFWNLVGNGQQPDCNGFIKIDTTKLTSSSSLFNESLHPNSSSYHASPFSQYLHQDSTDFGSIGGLVQNLQGRLNTWVQTSPTVLGFSQELVRSGNIADEYRLQALEAGEHVLEEVQKDAVQIFEKTSAVLSKKAQAFVIAHPELAGQVDELKHQVTEAADQVTEEVSKTLKSVGLKTLSMVYDGLKIAYDRSDRMTTEFPGRWKLFAGEMAERTLQVREAVKDVVDKTAVSLRDQSISTQVSPGGGIIAPTDYSATASTLPIGSNSSELHTGAFEGNVIAEAGAIVRSGAGRSFQAVAERYGFRSKVQFDAWKTGEMVDYSQDLGTKSDRWYRISGTDRWVSGAIITTNMNLDNSGQISKNSAPQVTTETPFHGRIIATQANVRSGAGSQFEDVGDRFYGDVVEFDGQVTGELIDYRSTLGSTSDKWFRIKGTKQLISAALVSTDLGGDQPAASGAEDKIKANLDLPFYKENNPLWQINHGGPNCTWYVNGRLKELGYDPKSVDKMLGNAHQWDDQARSAGLTVSEEPKVGMVAVWEPGHGGSSVFGHVAVVEQVNPDGSIVISESNWNSKIYNKRTIHPKISNWPDHFIYVEKTENKPVAIIKGVSFKLSAFDIILNKIKEIESTVPSSNGSKDGEYDPYAVANTLRRKGRDKYWRNSKSGEIKNSEGNFFDWVSGWNNRGADGYAKTESLSEFVRVTDPNDHSKDEDRTITLSNGMYLPISHFFAALSFQFGNLLPLANPYDNSYVGDLGSVIGAMRRPSFWLWKDYQKTYPSEITWEIAFKEKVGSDNNQLDADISAHVIAGLAKGKKMKISEAIEHMSKMTREEVLNQFTKQEFGIEISQLQNKDIANRVKNILKNEISSFLDIHGKSTLWNSSFAIGVGDLNQVAEYFINYLTQVPSKFPENLTRSKSGDSHGSSSSIQSETNDDKNVPSKNSMLPKSQSSHGYGL